MQELEELKRRIASTPETLVLTKNIKPNRWNFNVQSDRLFNALKNALKKFGKIYPVIVRETGSGKYEIIDGEHRWKALLQLKVKFTPVKNLGRVPDILAKELMMILNRTRGEANVEKLGLSLSRIVHTMEEEGENPLDVLPYDEEQLKRLIVVSEGFEPETEVEEIAPEEWKEMAESTRLCSRHQFKKVKMRRCKKCGILEESSSPSSE